MPQYRLREGINSVHMGDGIYLQSGQSVTLTSEQARSLPGLEPVLERDTPRATLERHGRKPNADYAPGQRVI